MEAYSKEFYKEMRGSLWLLEGHMYILLGDNTDLPPIIKITGGDHTWGKNYFSEESWRAFLTQGEYTYLEKHGTMIGNLSDMLEELIKTGVFNVRYS